MILAWIMNKKALVPAFIIAILLGLAVSSYISYNFIKNKTPQNFSNISNSTGYFKLECINNSDCDFAQLCINNTCKNIECKYCSYIQDHRCVRFECCKQEECPEDWYCDTVGHKCEPLNCQGTEQFVNHTCLPCEGCPKISPIKKYDNCSNDSDCLTDWINIYLSKGEFVRIIINGTEHIVSLSDEQYLFPYAYVYFDEEPVELKENKANQTSKFYLWPTNFEYENFSVYSLILRVSSKERICISNKCSPPECYNDSGCPDNSLTLEFNEGETKIVAGIIIQVKSIGNSGGSNVVYLRINDGEIIKLADKNTTKIDNLLIYAKEIYYKSYTSSATLQINGPKCTFGRCLNFSNISSS